MRLLTRFALNILSSFGVGPLSIGGELPGMPQVALSPGTSPIWIPISKGDFSKFADEINALKVKAKDEDDWKEAFRLLNQYLDNSPQGFLLAVILNNMAVAAYHAKREDLATLCIQRAKQVPVSSLEITRTINKNLRIMG